MPCIKTKQTYRRGNSNYIHGKEFFMKAIDDHVLKDNTISTNTKNKKDRKKDLLLISVEYGCVRDKSRKLNLGKRNKKQIWKSRKNVLFSQKLYYSGVLN